MADEGSIRSPIGPLLGQERALLVAELIGFVAAWEQAVDSALEPPAPAVRLFGQRSQALQARARQVGLGGIAHHLSRLDANVGPAGFIDRQAFRAALHDLAQLTAHARNELEPDERALVDQVLRGDSEQAAPGSLAPPPMLTVHPDESRSPAVRASPPPPTAPRASSSPPGPAGGARQQRTPAGTLVLADREAVRAAMDRTLASVAPLQTAAPPKLTHAQLSRDMPRLMIGEHERGRSDPPPGHRSSPPPPPPLHGPPHLASPGAAPPSTSASAGPNLRVRTMFGLRAFGRGAQKAASSSSGTVDAPPLQAGASHGLLGLGLGHPRDSASPASLAPPPLMSMKGPDLLAGPRFDRAPGRSDPPLEPPNRPSFERSSQPAADRRSNRPRTSRHPQRRSARPGAARPNTTHHWYAAIAAVLIVFTIVLAIVLWRRARSSAETDSPATGSAAASASAAPLALGEMPRSKLLNDDEQFLSLLAQVHGHGGRESPELAALVDEQAALQAKFLKAGKCEGSAAFCAKWEDAKSVLVGGDERKPIRRRTSSGPRSPWLAGLKLPAGFPIEDDPAVKRHFEYYTQNRVGRELFQTTLFRCGSYRDMIREKLVHAELPEALFAVLFVESGCVPLAKSPVGALGMWQFMPDSGRAYRLKIIDGALDERQNPTKSTDAALRYFGDLYAKFGKWDLAVAAYNVGPFGLLARVQRAGGDVGFWDLVDSDLLPDETADYVPRIQAFALILENLSRLKFAGAQMRSPQFTAELEVPPSTRLSLIARAAATSLVEIQRLNLDVLGPETPQIDGFLVQVPRDVVEQAREALRDLRAQGDDADLCVPATFDWGRQRFTPEMQQACGKKKGPQ